MKAIDGFPLQEDAVHWAELCEIENHLGEAPPARGIGIAKIEISAREIEGQLDFLELTLIERQVRSGHQHPPKEFGAGSVIAIFSSI